MKINKDFFNVERMFGDGRMFGIKSYRVESFFRLIIMLLVFPFTFLVAALSSVVFLSVAVVMWAFYGSCWETWDMYTCALDAISFPFRSIRDIYDDMTY